MAQRIYTANTSLDGYTADQDRNCDWGEPDEEVHTFISNLERDVGTYLYGRRLYDVMVAWENHRSESTTPLHEGLRAHLAAGPEGRVLADVKEVAELMRLNYDRIVARDRVPSAEADL